MPPKTRPPAERFWPKVNKGGPVPARRPELGPCWLWTANRSPLGYAMFRGADRMMGAHRWVYTETYGAIPEGMDIDHLCRVRHCVNPSHLQAVTHRENMLRGNTVNAMRASQAACVNGHPFTPENTYVRPDRGTRECRACLRERVSLQALRRQLEALREENAALRAEVARLRSGT